MHNIYCTLIIQGVELPDFLRKLDGQGLDIMADLY